MASKATAFLILVILFLFSFSTGEFDGSNTKMNLEHSPNKESDLDEDFFAASNFQDAFQMEIRKLLMVDRPDYDDPVANRKHEPQKPGTGKP